jgi:hypothetical protein
MFNFKLFEAGSLGRGGISEAASLVIENSTFFVATLAPVA